LVCCLFSLIKNEYWQVNVLVLQYICLSHYNHVLSCAHHVDQSLPGKDTRGDCEREARVFAILLLLQGGMDNPGWIPSNSFLDMVNPGVCQMQSEWLSYWLDNAILQLVPVSVFAYKERMLRIVGSLLVLIELSGEHSLPTLLWSVVVSPVMHMTFESVPRPSTAPAPSLNRPQHLRCEG